MNRLVFLIFSMILISCGGIKRNIVKPETYTTITPKLNEITNADIGNTLIYRENGHKYDAIEITKASNFTLNGVDKVIEEGEIFINQFNTNGYSFYGNSSDLEFGIAIPRSGKNPLIYTNSDGDGIYTTGINYDGLNLIRPNELIEYFQTEVKDKKSDYFKQELIYNGRVGVALKFIYREFLNDYARPAFTQDSQYDLSESKIIGFRGMRIEIINATNTEIEYKVLNYFE